MKSVFKVLATLILLTTPVGAVDLVSRSTNTLTTAATWGTVDAGSKLVSTTFGSTALTTGNLDSATFTPAAVILDRMCVKLASRAAGTPTNTMTITLRNSTTATNAQSVTMNVSDLDVADTTNRQGGWYCLKFSATHTPNGTDLYLIRATLSATSTAVSLTTNNVANNWQHMLVSTTTAAPAAGDDMHVAGQFDGATNPATASSFVVTMDSVAATDYGSAATSVETPALTVNKRGTLIYGVTAATNYTLRLSGNLTVFSGGVLNIGTVASPMPRDSVAVLEFDCAADGDFKLTQSSGSTRTLQGQSRTSGKNVFYTLLTANLAGGGGSATVADDTGWLAGDEVGIASTTRTGSQAEVLVLTSNAGASSLTFTGTAVNAHGGSTTDLIQAEVVLLTRNVILRSVSTTAMSLVRNFSATIDDDWVMFRYMGYGNADATPAYSWQGTFAATQSLEYGLFRDNEGQSLSFNASTGAGSVTVQHTASYNFCSTPLSNCAGLWLDNNIGSLTTLLLNDLVLISDGGTGVGVDCASPCVLPSIADLTNWRIAGTTSTGVSFTMANDHLGMDLGPWVIHSLGGSGFGFTNLKNATFGNLTIWRTNGTAGISAGTGALGINITMGTVLLFGNGTENLNAGSGVNIVNWRIKELKAYGDTTFSTSRGINLNATGTDSIVEIIIDKADFGTSNGSAYTTHSVADVLVQDLFARLNINNALMASTTEVSINASVEPQTYVSLQRLDRTDDNHKTMTAEGTVSYETGTVYVLGPSVKLTPLSATRKIDTAANIFGRGIIIGVEDGATKTISVQVRKNAAYNGNAPRLIIKANSSVGYDVDTVCDTLTVGADTWEELTCTTTAAIDDGAFEFRVDADGTAGAVFVDAWNAK